MELLQPTHAVYEQAHRWHTLYKHFCRHIQQRFCVKNCYLHTTVTKVEPVVMHVPWISLCCKLHSWLHLLSSLNIVYIMYIYTHDMRCHFVCLSILYWFTRALVTYIVGLKYFYKSLLMIHPAKSERSLPCIYYTSCTRGFDGVVTEKWQFSMDNKNRGNKYFFWDGR